MRGHAGASPDDKSITTRLTPAFVLASGGIKSENFFIDETIKSDSYKLLYRMWGNHQKLRFQNKDMGYLEIHKETEGNLVLFRICKVLVNYHNLNQRITAYLTCRNDGMNTPLSYEYSSRITDHALCTRNDLSLDRKGRIEKGHIAEIINGIEYRRKFDGNLMFDFTVYDMAMNKKTMDSFTYYENLYSLKPNNRLIRTGSSMNLGNHEFNLMIHYGTALTERIFYISGKGLPVMMIQNSAAYILDANAKEATNNLMEELNTGGVHYEY
jgi:hypothetical protein